MNNLYELWIDKYKPTKIEEFIGNKFIINILNNYIDNNNNIPNFILNGENGTGKKTIINLLINKYNNNPEYILKINGLLFNNKDANNNKYNDYDILSFVQFKTKNNIKKILIIYNFDELSIDIQHYLRSIIEKYINTIFIFTCNNISNIIESIKSRLLIFDIKKLSNKKISKILINIIKSRNDINFKMDNIELNEIIENINIFSNGDLKKAINYLQIFSYSENPTLNKFYTIFNFPSFKKLKKMIDYSQDLKTINKSYNILNNLFKKGFSANNILEILNNIIILSNYPNKHKFLEYISNIYINMDIEPNNIHLYNFVRKISKK